MASKKKGIKGISSIESSDAATRYVINEKEIGEVFNTAALKVANEIIVILNTLLRIPNVDYRKYKKVPKDKLEGVLEYLIRVATTQPEEVPDNTEHPGVVIKEAYKQSINEYIIERRGPSLIQQMLFEKHNVDIKKPTIAAYIVKYKKTSEYLKIARDWEEDIGDLRLYHKRGRLTELEELYIDAYRNYKISSSRTNVDMCLKILEQARKEAMPIMNQVNINNTNISANIFTNILAKEEELSIFERLPLHEIIIGRVAAKYNRDPYLLQRRLQNSYYAAQAGSHGMDKIGEPIEYPTAILYNVEDLGAKWKNIQAEEAKEIQESNKEESLIENPSDIKLALLKRVEEMKRKKQESKDDSE